MARDTAALLARVQKLLALATSNNVHEAAAAAARAQALIEAHQLEGLLAQDARDVVDIGDGRDAPLEVGRRLRRWKVVLATVLGEHNGCVAWTEDRGDDTALCLAGRVADREVTAALYAWLVVRIEWLSATHGAGRDRRWHEAFRVGAAEAIAARLAESPTDAHANDNDTDDASTALVKADRQRRRDAVDRYVAEHLRLGRGRGFAVDAHGYRRGQKVGADVAVDTLKPGSRR
jgi:hypothetical protein